MTQVEFEKAVKSIMEATNDMLKEAKSDKEKFSILEGQNSSIEALLNNLN